jgi:hypothetical protein
MNDANESNIAVVCPVIIRLFLLKFFHIELKIRYHKPTVLTYPILNMKNGANISLEITKSNATPDINITPNKNRKIYDIPNSKNASRKYLIPSCFVRL